MKALLFLSILSKSSDILQGQMTTQELQRNLILVQMKLKSLYKWLPGTTDSCLKLAHWKEISQISKGYIQQIN